MKRWTIKDWRCWGREMRVMCDTIDSDGNRLGAKTAEECWKLESALGGGFTDISSPAEEATASEAFIAGWAEAGR